MNLLDRALGYLSPERAVRRAAARVALDSLRAYDGAMMGRRTAGWQATNKSANAEIKGSLPRLRARSRDVMRNTWWGARIRSVTVSHAVGTGIVPKPNTGNKALDRRFKRAWAQWCKAQHCDKEGQLNFDAQTALAVGCIVEAGEVLGHMIPARDAPAGVVPLRLQLLEPDHLDATRDSIRLVSDGASAIDQGIEYDARGRRLAFWLHPLHPGNGGIIPHKSVRVPAAHMLHAYRKERIGQGRGVPWVAPVLLKGRDVADVEEAITIKMRVEACLAAFVTTTNVGNTLADKTRTEPGRDGKPRRIESMSPGMVAYLEPGEQVQSVAPSSSAQFESVLMTNWLTLAAGAGITYDQLTGDLRRANYSSLKAGKIEFRRQIEQFQWHTIIGMWLDPLIERWTEVAIDAGILPYRRDGYAVEWITPANEPIDPLKDMQADILAVRSGRMTFAQFVGAWGLDAETQLDDIASWLADLDRLKVSLDCDPRRPTVSPKSVGRSARDDRDNLENDDDEKD